MDGGKFGEEGVEHAGGGLESCYQHFSPHDDGEDGERD